MQTKDRLVTVFLSNECATLAEGAKYEDLIVVGLETSQTQKNAAREGWCVGAVIQMPIPNRLSVG